MSTPVRDLLIKRLAAVTTPDGNPIDTQVGLAENTTLVAWLQDAAAKIADRRGKTTTVEDTIELVTDQALYDLPVDCVTVQHVIPVGDTEGEWGVVGDMGVPNPGLIPNFGGGFVLPTGQSASASVQLIQAQRARLASRELSWGMYRGQLRLDFPTQTGRSVKIVYTAEDRDVENVPARYYELMLAYAKSRLVQSQRLRLMTIPDATADSTKSNQIAQLDRLQRELNDEWETGLAAVSEEAT